MNRKLIEHHLFDIFCDIINAFTLIFDPFNAYLLNKCLSFLLSPIL